MRAGTCFVAAIQGRFQVLPSLYAGARASQLANHPRRSPPQTRLWSLVGHLPSTLLGKGLLPVKEEDACFFACGCATLPIDNWFSMSVRQDMLSFSWHVLLPVSPASSGHGSLDIRHAQVLQNTVHVPCILYWYAGHLKSREMEWGPRERKACLACRATATGAAASEVTAPATRIFRALHCLLFRKFSVPPPVPAPLPVAMAPVAVLSQSSLARGSGACSAFSARRVSPCKRAGALQPRLVNLLKPASPPLAHSQLSWSNGDHGPTGRRLCGADGCTLPAATAAAHSRPHRSVSPFTRARRCSSGCCAGRSWRLCGPRQRWTRRQQAAMRWRTPSRRRRARRPRQTACVPPRSSWWWARARRLARWVLGGLPPSVQIEGQSQAATSQLCMGGGGGGGARHAHMVITPAWCMALGCCGCGPCRCHAGCGHRSPSSAAHALQRQLWSSPCGHGPACHTAISAWAASLPADVNATPVPALRNAAGMRI